MKNNHNLADSIAIIGAMGKEAARYFDRLLDQQSGFMVEQDFPSTVIIQNTRIDDRSTKIINNIGDPVAGILRSLTMAESLGLKTAVIPCNTAHYFIEELIAKTSINIIDMLEVATSDIAINSKVGLLATTGTIEAKIYDKYLAKRAISTHSFSDDMQELIHAAIFGQKTGRKLSNGLDERANNGIKASPNFYQQSVELLITPLQQLEANNIETIILGCTELPLVKGLLQQKFPHMSFIDPMEALARHLLREIIP